MKLPYILLMPCALASALTVQVNNVTTNETVQGGREVKLHVKVYGKGPEHPAPASSKVKRDDKNRTPEEVREWEEEIKHIAGGGIDYGAIRAWKSKPWLKPDEFAEDWFALDYEVCRNSIPVDDVEGCVVFRSLEWLLFSMTHTVGQITSTDTDVLYRHNTEQRGPFTLTIRAVLIWTEILRDFKVQLEATRVLNVHSQLKLVPCYLDYVFQATAFLQVLEAQGSDFREEDPLRCLMFDKMEILYLLFKSISELLHGSDPAIRKLFDARFPDRLPNTWHSKYEVPKKDELISDYVRRNDWAILGDDSPFRRTQAAWRCVDDRQQFAAQYPTKWGKWKEEGMPSKRKWLEDKKAQARKASKQIKKQLDFVEPATRYD